MEIEALCKQYLAAEGMWRGCDWDTSYGDGHLNLNGLRAQQAQILANATAGVEAARWRDAVSWLKKIEQDALAAEREAAQAVKAVIEGRRADADRHLALACAIEARYPEHRPIWETLRTALEVPPEKPPPLPGPLTALQLSLLARSPQPLAC